jgi:hypothetical protein
MLIIQKTMERKVLWRVQAVENSIAKRVEFDLNHRDLTTG